MNKFLEYVPGNSLLHRMNPVAKLIGAILFALACFMTGNLILLVALLVAGLVLAASCHMMRQTAGLMKAVLAFSVILAAILIFTTPTATSAQQMTSAITSAGAKGYSL